MRLIAVLLLALGLFVDAHAQQAAKAQAAGIAPQETASAQEPSAAVSVLARSWRLSQPHTDTETLGMPSCETRPAIAR